MLSHRRYADFRTDYNKGLDDLLEVLRQEQENVADKRTILQLEKPCVLYSMSGAKLRKLLNKRLQFSEIKDICFDLEEPDYENLTGETKNEKIVELLIYFKNRNKLKILLNWFRDNRPDLCLED